MTTGIPVVKTSQIEMLPIALQLHTTKPGRFRAKTKNLIKSKLWREITLKEYEKVFGKQSEDFLLGCNFREAKLIQKQKNYYCIPIHSYQNLIRHLSIYCLCQKIKDTNLLRAH